MTSPDQPAESAQYIPKFIQNVPWYYKIGQDSGDDKLAHQRKDPYQVPVDHSLPQAGTGIRDEDRDDYDSKRDRWHGHSAEQWDDILAKWNQTKRNTATTNTANDDSDDTDYELEREELGLGSTLLKSGHLEDPMEKAIRDRRDVPAYILALNSNEGGKIRLGKDSTASLVSDLSDFVKKSKDSADFEKMQKFAWEQSKVFDVQQQKKRHDAHLALLRNPNVAQEEAIANADLGSSMEASPTLLMQKKKKEDQQRKKAGDEKRRKLLERYG